MASSHWSESSSSPPPRYRCSSDLPQQNKAFSDSSDEILRLQGVSWFKRRAISIFTPTLCIKHTADEAGVEHIDTEQTLSGGLPGTLREGRILDWQEHDENNDLFGFVTGKSHRIPLEEVTDEFLKQDWSQDTVDDGIIFCDYWSPPDKNSYTWKGKQVITLSSLVVLLSSLRT